MGIKYDPRPELADMPISIDDIEALLNAGGKALLDKRRIVHFLKRVRAKLLADRRSNQELALQLEDIRMRATTQPGRATTLDPMDAARFLTDEQRAQLGGQAVFAQYQLARRKREEADGLFRQAIITHNAVKLAYDTIVASPDVPDHVKQQLAAQLPPQPTEPKPAAEGQQP